jgi:SAM-dependent methyltransferase
MRQVGLPPEDLRATFNEGTGEAALEHGRQVYECLRQLALEHGGLERSQTVLDFGCGWGRIARYFVQDVDDLWGVDPNDEAIAACQETNPWGSFKVIGGLGPTGFPDETFDLIYSWSVFSHLPEDLHLSRLAEFRQILKPGGLALVSTHAREFLADRWASLVAPYDRGEFSYTGERYFGEAAIPESYARARWPLAVLDFVDGPGQNMIVARAG